MPRSSTLMLMLLVSMAGCGGSGTTTDASSSGVGSTGSGAGATGTSGSASTGTSGGGPTTTQGMSGSETTASPGTSTGGAESSSATAGSSSSESSSGASTGTASTGTAGTSSGGTEGSTGEGSSGGGQCGGELTSCAKGELCCDGLQCCVGNPVPQGQEFCSMMCPKSDRNAKTGFIDVDAGEVLRKVVALPITSWRYRKDGAEVRHIGPMAQDFHAAFGLWNSDTMIFPLDASGVSMAAIQGLHARVVAAEAENEALRARLERLERRLGE